MKTLGLLTSLIGAGLVLAAATLLALALLRAVAPFLLVSIVLYLVIKYLP